MVGNFLACCARAMSGQAAAEPTIPLMKLRRRIAFPKAKDRAGSLDYSRDLRPAEWDSGGCCKAAILNRSCPLWVKSGHHRTFKPCLLYPADIMQCSNRSYLLGHALLNFCQ
jgi:hypothetical protein